MAENSDDEYPAQYRNNGGSAKPNNERLNRDKPPRNFNGPGPNGIEPGHQPQRESQYQHQAPGGRPPQGYEDNRHPVMGGPSTDMQQNNGRPQGQRGQGGHPSNSDRLNNDQLNRDKPPRNFNGPGVNVNELGHQPNYDQPQRESQYTHLTPGGRPPQGYEDYRTSMGPNRDSQHVYTVMGGPSADMQQNNGRPHPQGYRGQGAPPPNYGANQVYDNPVQHQQEPKFSNTQDPNSQMYRGQGVPPPNYNNAGQETERRSTFPPNMQSPPRNQQEQQFSNIQDMESNPEDEELRPSRSPPTESQPTPRSKPVMILGKDMTLIKLYKASLAAWLSLVTLIVSAFFFIIAFASAGWAVVDTVDSPGYTRRLGLWQSCHSQFGCTYLGVTSVSDGYRAAQAFATISLLTLMGGCAVTVLYIAWQRVTFEDRSKLGKIAVGCRGLTVILLFLTITIYGDRYRDGRYNTPAYSGRLSWAYGFATLVFFIEIGGCVLMALETFIINKAPPRTQFE